MILRIDNTGNARLTRNSLQTHRKTIMSILYKTNEGSIFPDPCYDDDKPFLNNNLYVNNSIKENDAEHLDIILQRFDFEQERDEILFEKYKRRHGGNRFSAFYRNFMFFYNKACGFDSSELDVFTDKLLNKCVLIEIRSLQFDQAVMMFNSLNSDGVPLNDSDIVFSKMYANAQSKGIINEYQEKYEELLYLMKELEKYKISIDSILTQEMYFERAKVLSSNDTNYKSVPSMRKYFTSINTEFISDPVKSCDKLINLANNWTSIILQPITKVLLMLNVNLRYFLACYIYQFSSNEIKKEGFFDSKVKPILECLMRLFILQELGESGYSGKLYKNFMFDVNKLIVDKTKSVKDIKVQFDTHINKYWTEKEVNESIKSYSKKPLVYVNEYLFSCEKEMDFDLSEPYDVEHIMSNSGKDKVAIRQDAGINGSEEFMLYVNQLGNRIVLESEINRTIGNEWFRVTVKPSAPHKKASLLGSNIQAGA